MKRLFTVGVMGALLVLGSTAWSANVAGAKKAAAGKEWVYSHPVSASDHYDLGRHYHDTGNYEMMLLEFRKFLQMKPGDYRGMNNVGVAYALLGQYDLARIMWERTLKVKPGDQFAKDNIRYLERVEKGEVTPATKPAKKAAKKQGNKEGKKASKKGTGKSKKQSGAPAPATQTSN